MIFNYIAGGKSTKKWSKYEDIGVSGVPDISIVEYKKKIVFCVYVPKK